MFEWMIFSVLGIVVLYGCVLAGIYFNQSRLQYSPSHRDIKAQGNSIFKPWKNLRGEFLGYYRPMKEKARKAVLVFHGNDGEALDRIWMHELVSPQDLLFLIEYPGYGGRKGQPSEKSFRDAADGALKEVQQRWGKIPVTVVGERLGSAIACYLASKHDVVQLALISPVPSSVDVAWKKLGFLPGKWILRDKFKTKDFIEKAKAPLHVIHGTLDDNVPLSAAKKVFEVSPSTNKNFAEIPGFGHGNLGQAVLHSPYASSFRSFMES
jgi:pimeloyl-ACP methyl ester carboxylesterase